MEHPETFTEVDPGELARVFAELVGDVSPRPELVAVLLAQSALETGHWGWMRSFNFGNVKATDRWIELGGGFTFFATPPPHAPAPVSENLTHAQVQPNLKLARPRPDAGGLDMHVGELIEREGAPDLYRCWFWPRHVQARFRAFGTLLEGAESWSKLLRGKYREALEPASRGDVRAYCAALKRLGPYFLEDVDRYANVVGALFRKYLPTAEDALRPRPRGATMYATRFEDIEIHHTGTIELASGTKITALPLLDRGNRGPVFCRGSETAAAWLAERSGRLPTANEYRELHRLCGKDGPGVHVIPYPMPTVSMLKAAGIPLSDQKAIQRFLWANMASAEWCTMHDHEMMRRYLEATDGKADRAADNIGKHIDLDGDIIGGERQDGDPEWKWIQPESGAHRGHQQLDYMTLVHGAFDPAPEGRIWLAGFKEAGIDPATMTLGERCLAWTGYQLGLGVREIPGARHDPRILAYSQHARRGGRFRGVDVNGRPLWDGGTRLPMPTDDPPWHWCAYTVGGCLAACLLPGETPPHGIRASVREIVEDARAAGTLMPLSWTPTPGSLAIEARAGGNPLHGGPGHVRRVAGVNGGSYFGIGANETDGTGKPDGFAVDWYDTSGLLRPSGHRLVAWVRV